jgi:hypothetical protein
MQRQHKENEMQRTGVDDWRELAQRVHDGLEITLLWAQLGNRVKVAVADERTGEKLEVEVRPSAALSVFYHPFAHGPSPRAPMPERATPPSGRVGRVELEAPPTNPWDDAEEWA